ncbi:aspartyl protease family protein [Tardiphaga sp. P5_C7]
MPERIAPVYEDRSSYIAPIIFVGMAVVGFGLWLYSDVISGSLQSLKPTPAYQAKYKRVYEQLGISSLPPEFQATQTRASRLLDQLLREPCDREAIVPLATLINDAGYPREAATSVRKYGEQCGHIAELLEIAYASLTRVGDLTGAVGTATEMIDLDVARSRYRFLRGTAYEGLKNYKAALSDYVSTLQLFSDLSNVAPSEFYRISRMYDAIGRPCDAITPLEMYLSYDVAKRQTTQISQMITEFANKGKCRATYATGNDRILISANNYVDVIINGARGRMILDTGASIVSMTPSFAARARIMPDESNLMTFQVVGGTVQNAPGYAQLIQVGNARAANVPVAISIGNDNAFGAQIDGLLGMTFLARFNVTLSNGALELKPRALN